VETPRVPWGLVVLAREYPCGPEVTAAAAAEHLQDPCRPSARGGRTGRAAHVHIHAIYIIDIVHAVQYRCTGRYGDTAQ